MDIIHIGMKEFISKVAEPKGIPLDNLERMAKSELAGEQDLTVHVGNVGYVIVLSSIKDYFSVKAEDEKPPEEVGKEVFDEFMKPEPEKVKKGGGK